jgi:hypothetical protein
MKLNQKEQKELNRITNEFERLTSSSVKSPDDAHYENTVSFLLQIITKLQQPKPRPT